MVIQFGLKLCTVGRIYNAKCRLEFIDGIRNKDELGIPGEQLHPCTFALHPRNRRLVSEIFDFCLIVGIV